MAARHTTRKKIQPTAERLLRLHRIDVKYFKKWCKDNEITYMDYDEAELHDICVISLNEYDLHEERINIYEDCESYFLTQEDYEKWCEE